MNTLTRAVASRILPVSLALAAAVLTTPANAASVGDQSGVRIFGTSDFLYQPCATLACDTTSGNWSSASQGGPGQNLAIGEGTGGVTSGNADFTSRAILVGATAVPLLKAYTAAYTEFGTYPGYSSDCCYLNSATASAQAAQYYTYIGTEPMDYQIYFSLDGAAGGNFSTITGGLLLYDGLNANIEMPYGGYLDGVNVSVSSSDPDGGGFLRGGFVSTTLNPGDGFYLYAYLTANVPRESEGFADASNTFTTSFTTGDTSLLVPYLAAAPVPVPASIWLLATGLGFFGAMARRSRLRPERTPAFQDAQR